MTGCPASPLPAGLISPLILISCPWFLLVDDLMDRVSPPLPGRPERPPAGFPRAPLVSFASSPPFFFQGFALARYFPAGAFRENVLSERRDRVPRDYLAPDGGLYHN